jgi:acyl carrier protein
METEVEKKLSEIFKIVLDLPDDAETKNIRRINEVNWDSLAQVTLVTALESEFGIQLDHSEAERLTSYQSTLLLLTEKISS